VATRNRGRGIAIFLLILGGLQISATPSGSLEQAQDWNSFAEEPITRVPEPPAIDPLKIRLGERLFGDPRLSHDNSRSCSSCHDLGTNGANTKGLDVGLDGSSLSLNTPTLFNATLNFRFGVTQLLFGGQALLEKREFLGVLLARSPLVYLAELKRETELCF